MRISDVKWQIDGEYATIEATMSHHWHEPFDGGDFFATKRQAVEAGCTFKHHISHAYMGEMVYYVWIRGRVQDVIKLAA